MLKKVLSILMLLVLSLTLFYQPRKAEAVGVDTLVKVGAKSEGANIIAGMAEKSGVKMFYQFDRTKMVEMWNKQVEDKVKEAEAAGKHFEALELERLNNMVATVQPTELLPANTNGYSKFVINTAMFLTSADIIYDMYSAFDTARRQNLKVEIMDDIAVGLQTGEYYTSFKGYSTSTTIDPVTKEQLVMESGPTWPLERIMRYPSNDVIFSYLTLNTTNKIVYLYVNVNGSAISITNWTYSDSNTSPTLKKTPVSPSDVFDLPTTVNPLLDQIRAPGIQTIPLTETDPSPVPIPDTYSKTVDINVPDTVTYPDTVSQPWNEPLTESVTPTVPTDSATDPVGDTTTIHWDKLKQSGEALTTVFPFSLPWDIKRMIDSVVVVGEKPHWTFSLPIMGHTYSGDVSLPTMMEPFVPIMRGFFVLLFIIGLIFGTRTLLGGAV